MNLFDSNFPVFLILGVTFSASIFLLSFNTSVSGSNGNDLYLGVSEEEISLDTSLAGDLIGGKIELKPGGSLVGGMIFKDRFSPKEGWDYSPFFLTRYDESTGIGGFLGMKGNFFSYQLGSWMYRSNFSLMTNFSKYRFDGRGQFSVGNYRAVGLFRVNIGKTLSTLWPGDKLTNYRRSILFGSFRPFHKPKENFGYLELIRKLDFRGSKFEVSGGVGYFSSTETYPETHYTLRTGFEDSFVSLTTAGFLPRTWSVYLKGSALRLGMAGIIDRKISLLVGYDFPPGVELEITSREGEVEIISLILKSSW